MGQGGCFCVLSGCGFEVSLFFLYSKFYFYVMNIQNMRKNEKWDKSDVRKFE